MRSRVLMGVGAWLLGALTATAGSLYAVDLLGQGLLEQHSKQVSVSMVNAELALENSNHTGHSIQGQATQRPMPQGSGSQRAGRMPPSMPGKARPLTSRRASPPGAGAAGKLLTSAGGTAEAACQGGMAYLMYWSPAQGFEVDRVQPGPVSAASVTFTDSSGGVAMHVTCTASGVPIAHTSSFQWGSGGQHDE